jgi:hypothetical protein
MITILSALVSLLSFRVRSCASLELSSSPCDISLSFLGGKAPRRPVTVISTRKSESDPFRTSALVQKPRILCQVKVRIFASRITMVTPVALW